MSAITDGSGYLSLGLRGIAGQDRRLVWSRCSCAGSEGSHVIGDFPSEEFQEFKASLAIQSDPGGATVGNQLRLDVAIAGALSLFN
ncbi:MAG: hypothetical protein ACKO01_06280 [Erythrobacter sp.]